MPSHVDIISLSIFHRCLLPTWTSESRKFEPPLQWEHDFLKIAFRCSHGFLVRCWCQLGTILAPQILQNPPKNRSQEASFFWSIFASIFYRFLLVIGSQLGAMLATFSLNRGGPCGVLPCFLWGLCYFSILGPSWPPLGSILGGWGSILLGFWLILGSILEGFGLQFGSFWWPCGSHVFSLFGETFCLLVSGSGWAGGVTRNI